ncbi:DUF4214 domain-containing protein [Pseudoduganella lutea]|uniref:DUF4214 domain-containing protein n=1 Tax=Pseudoduganella lutea TaxID=321985 RepID=A0A4P6KZS0_9BURK|nr:DUF4214 domain-containing protein [Pseudoduganella lutea]QBE64636.1 DUF4214 domain-containing protein [Pseudoduganella lutea]
MADSPTFQGGTAANDTLTGGAGTDHLFGQGGADVLIGGGGDDNVNSGEYSDTNSPLGFRFDFIGDRLDGGEGNDLLVGGSGSDLLIGGAGTNRIEGGAGNDTAIYAGARSDYTVAMQNGVPAGVRSISGVSVSDTLASVERLSFSDGAIAYDINGSAGDIYRLYRAAFDRVPDEGGLGFWISVSDRNYSAPFIAGELMASPEFIAKYGTSSTNEQFLTNVYANILDRAYDQGGFDYWKGVLEGGLSRAEVLNHIAQSAENRATVIGEIQTGIEYTLYTA